jgi:hypothetical protein
MLLSNRHADTIKNPQSGTARLFSCMGAFNSLICITFQLWFSLARTVRKHRP